MLVSLNSSGSSERCSSLPLPLAKILFSQPIPLISSSSVAGVGQVMVLWGVATPTLFLSRNSKVQYILLIVVMDVKKVFFKYRFKR